MIPAIFRTVPEQLRLIDVPLEPSELSAAYDVRRRFEMDAYPDPYMDDIVRTFRIIDNSMIYVEVGTRDKGNLAWVSKKLSPNATIIDVDIDKFDDAELRLRKELGNIEYSRTTGDSIAPSTLAQIKTCLGDRKADAIFCDSSHMYEHALAEFELYFPLLRSGGCLMFHDCFWEGNESDKGKCQAMMLIDRHVPVYSVFMHEPVHRFLPRSRHKDVWGGVSIILKP